MAVLQDKSSQRVARVRKHRDNNARSLDGKPLSSDRPPHLSLSLPLQSNRKENKGGYLCHSCAEQRIGPLAFLTASPEQVHSMERTVENIVLPRHEALLFLVF